MKKVKYIITQAIFFAFIFFSLIVFGCTSGYVVKSGEVAMNLSEQGEIIGLSIKGKSVPAGFSGKTLIEGSNSTFVSSRKIEGGWEFEKNITSPLGNCKMFERFYSVEGSIRWEVEIQGDANPWSTPIQTIVKYPVTIDKTTLWSPWGAPQIQLSDLKCADLKKHLKLMPDSESNWLNPLAPIPFTNAIYYYGAPYVTLENPQIAYCPFNTNLISIPMVSVIEAEKDYGLSVVLSLEDEILDLTMSTDETGVISFSRYYHRIVDAHPVKFALDIIHHEPDWRSGMNWMTQRYAAYFEPSNSSHAFELNGTSAYTNHDVNFDVQKMKDMAFATNWQASFDFPYMGMFIPPVKGEKTEWKRFGGEMTSVKRMKDYAAKMKESGFHVLNYFNVTEFGTKVEYPAPALSIKDRTELWRNCNDFLYRNLSDAMLYIPMAINLKGCIYPKSVNGGPFYTWEDAVVLDCGVPAYKTFLLEQAKRHLEMIPESDGFCIDRMDWLRMYNEKYDDGISWFDNKPVRSLTTSWKGFMEELAPMVHSAGKLIFVNNHTKRIDLLKHVDGYFDEFTYAEAPLNTTAFLALKKPALGWTSGKYDIEAQGVDDFFQKYLYMGVFPMCPFPGNDHSIHPDEWVDRAYLDYGPLLQQMKYRKWVLSPNPVIVESDNAKANIFEVPGGYIIPVVYATEDEPVRISLPVVDISKSWDAVVYFPGQEDPVRLNLENVNNQASLTVPTQRNTAMVKLQMR